MESESVNAPLKKERLYYLDWLKVFAILMVFIFHNAHFFDPIDWSLKNDTQSSSMTIIFLLIHFWSMPLFFFLAGAGTKYALKFRSRKEYVFERIKRLLIPFCIGMLILAPPQGYVESMEKLKYKGSFIDYYPQFFLNLFHSFSPEALGKYTYHLWFLGFLFIFSLVALPFFGWLNKGKIRLMISKIALFSNKKGFIFLFALPILASHLILRVKFPNYNDVADFFYWLIYFLYGYILFSNIKFSEIINKHYKSAFFTGLFCIGLMILFLISGHNVEWFEYPSYSFASVIFMVVYSLLTWSWVIFFLGAGFNLLNFSNKFLKYSTEALLPFYLLHQTVILIIGFYVLDFKIDIFFKFLIISTSSFILTVLIYDLLIKRFNPIRFLFGMKPIKAVVS